LLQAWTIKLSMVEIYYPNLQICESVTIAQFCPSLIFTWKAGAYLSKAPYGNPLLVQAHSLY